MNKYFVSFSDKNHTSTQLNSTLFLWELFV